MFALTFAAVKIHEEQFLKKMVGQMALDEFCANIILIINNICFYLIYSFIKKKKRCLCEINVVFPPGNVKNFG